MNSVQASIMGVLFFFLGLAALGYGGYELWLAWDHNSAIAETDSAVGGLLSTFSEAVGADMSMPYQKGGLFAGAGFVVAFIGWLFFGKIK